jgi:hypothetical protein
MSARAFDNDDQSAQNDFRAPHLAAFPTTRYRLDVIACDVADMIQSAGGWLFDRAICGWDVNLLAAEPGHFRSLQILGVTSLAHHPPFETPTKGLPNQALAVAAEVFNTDARVREVVIAALEFGRTEVTLWGDTWPSEFHKRAEHLQHRLSAAARAFKVQALKAAALPTDQITTTERFCGGARWYPPYESDLTPIE